MDQDQPCDLPWHQGRFGLPMGQAQPGDLPWHQARFDLPLVNQARPERQARRPREKGANSWAGVTSRWRDCAQMREGLESLGAMHPPWRKTRSHRGRPAPAGYCLHNHRTWRPPVWRSSLVPHSTGRAIQAVRLRVHRYIEHFLPIFGQIILRYILPTFGLKSSKWVLFFAPRYEQRN